VAREDSPKEQGPLSGKVLIKRSPPKKRGEKKRALWGFPPKRRLRT